jgi:hypothetical protein
MPRLRRVALVSIIASALALPACFDPDYPADLPCGPDRFCPSGQICSADDICLSIAGAGTDASFDANIDSGPLVDAGPGDLLSIDIGLDQTLALNATYTFVVTAMYENASEQVDNTTVIWESTDNAIVFVDFMGVAHPQAEGVATITADFNGRIDTADFTITPAM